MKPTVIANANASASTGSGPNNAQNGITIPINRDYGGAMPQQHHQSQQPHPQYHTQAQHYVGGDPQNTAYGSPGSYARAQPQQYPPQQQQQTHPQQQQIPAHFQQDFDFEPDMDMFPRTRLGRMAHDPFADFGGSHFGFPQFNSLGRRRANNTNHDDDFFTRLPSEFRQYIPEGFGQRRGQTATGMPGSPGTQGMHTTQTHIPQQHQQQQPQQQHMPQQQMPPQYYHTMPQSPSKKVCDAAIQTEDPNAGYSEVDHAVHSDNLNQHGLRNTMDMGIKSALENDEAAFRSHSAPPNEPLQQQKVYQPQQQIPVSGQRQTPATPQQHGGRPQFGTQTSPPVQSGGYAGQAPQFQKAYYPPPQQTHSQQKQQTPPPPQTPGGTYIRTIPIFVEGRSEPIINNKEIPNQNAPPNVSSTGRGFTPPRQQQPPQFPQPQQHQQQTPAQPQHRPTPLNTQQQPEQQTQSTGLPPQTPHTVDSINKIQDIQRDVLELMTCVEQFTGTRPGKEYAYLDEMLTRNLLKLDNIDTNGKESIRLARKEAIKCIQASINVLEAKAEENKKAQQGNGAAAASADQETAEAPQKSSSGAKVVTKDSSQTKLEQEPEEPVDVKKIQEPIPLPPPEGMMVETKTESTAETTSEVVAEKEKTPVPEQAQEECKQAKSKSSETVATESAATTETK